MKRWLAITMLLLLQILIRESARAEDIAELFNRSRAYEAKGEYSEALNSALKIVLMDTGNYDALLRAGWLFYRRQDYNASQDYYRKASNLKPGAIEPLLGRTLPLMASEKWEEAERVAEAIISKDPRNYLAGSRLAYILFSRAMYGRAAGMYEKVLELYPGDTDMKLGLAWSLYRMGRIKRSGELFRQVLMVDSGNTSAGEGAALTGIR